MQVAWYLVYVSIGSIAGMIYGLLFLTEKQGALFRVLPPDEPDKKRRFPVGMVPHFLWTVLRLLILALLLLYLLPLGTIPFILVMISFLLFFWLIITGKIRGIK
jgi:hypothetical protein